MKTIKKAVAAAAGAALVLLGADAMAGGALKSCNVTNYLNSGTPQVFGFPTNVVAGTNGVYLSTGLPVNIADTRDIGINVQGFLRNVDAAGQIYLVFTSSMNPGGAGLTGGRPTVVTGTNLYSVNQTVILDNDFMSESNNMFKVTVPYPATTTNYFNWNTNFNATGWQVGASANWIGVYMISNSFGAGDFITNFQVNVNTKLIPAPLIGN